MTKRLEMLERLIAHGSKDPFHHYARALELRSIGRAADALTALTQVVTEFPDYVPSYLIAAQLAEQTGQRDQAKTFASRGIEAAKREGNEHALSELTSMLDGLGA